MYKPIINNVRLAPMGASEQGHRLGTAFLTLKQFEQKIGKPHYADYSRDGIDGDGKVHAVWIIKTPRGNAAVRDYWWNPKDQLSICAPDFMTFLWAKNWLKIQGVECVTNKKPLAAENNLQAVMCCKV